MKKDFLYTPKYIYWELSTYCNLKCKHCFSESSNDVTTVVKKEKVLIKIDEMSKKSKFSIRFGGGEPLLVPYIYEIVQFCEARDIKTAITTNGTLINEMVIERLRCSGLKELTVSIDGLEDKHNFLRGNNNYERAINAVKLALNSKNIKVSVAFTITSYNYEDIEPFVDRMVELGVKKIYFFRYCMNSNAELLKLNAEQLYFSAKEIIRMKEKYRDIKFIYENLGFYSFLLVDNFNNNFLGCNFLKDVMTVKYNGDVVVCAAISKVLGNLFTDDIHHIYNNIFAEKVDICKIPIECMTCMYSKSCRGGCKSDSYYKCGDYSYRDELCYIAHTLLE